MHKAESVPKNEMHNILWEVEMQVDHPIPTRRADEVIINNNNKRTSLKDLEKGNGRMGNQRKN